MVDVQDYHPKVSFGEEVAAIYDDEPRGDEADAVRFLSRLAGDGRALELAVGTGRIALPLAAAGVRVDGIDLSEAMVAKLPTSRAVTPWMSPLATSPTCRGRQLPADLPRRTTRLLNC